MSDTGAAALTIASRFVDLAPCALTTFGIATSVAEPAMKVRRFIRAPKLFGDIVADEIGSAEDLCPIGVKSGSGTKRSSGSAGHPTRDTITAAQNPVRLCTGHSVNLKTGAPACWPRLGSRGLRLGLRGRFA